jgi:hypothetical protein
MLSSVRLDGRGAVLSEGKLVSRERCVLTDYCSFAIVEFAKIG